MNVFSKAFENALVMVTVEGGPIFGSDRSPRSQDVCVSVCLCDIMLKNTLKEFLMDLQGLKESIRGP